MAKLISRLRCLFGFHEHTYRERRSLHSFDVLHYVCDVCSHAEPAIVRDPEEYREFWKLRTPTSKARKALPPSAAERSRVLESVRPFRRAK